MIIIGADIVPTASNMNHFENGTLNELIGDQLRTLMDNSDYRILNLEVPLTDSQNPIEKCGPNLIASTRSVTGIKNMKIDLLTLANNHIMDQGVEGLKCTTDLLKKSGIAYTGVGDNIREASLPFYFSAKGRKYGVYACAEHEFSIADDNHPGANPFDPLESPEHIAAIKNNCDYVIVLYHGGKEHYRYPSPNLQKTCRKMVEKGADLVICQHSHCVGCKEEFMKGTIIYGQGNYLFDGQDNEYWNSGLLVSIEDDGHIHYYPLKKDGSKTHLANGTEGENIIQGFMQRSEEIKDQKVIFDKYRSFSDDNLTNYVMHFSGLEGDLFYKIINKISCQKVKKAFIKKYVKCFGTVVRNFVECEAHRELLVEALKNASDELREGRTHNA